MGKKGLDAYKRGWMLTKMSVFHSFLNSDDNQCLMA